MVSFFLQVVKQCFFNLMVSSIYFRLKQEKLPNRKKNIQNMIGRRYL